MWLILPRDVGKRTFSPGVVPSVNFWELDFHISPLISQGGSDGSFWFLVVSTTESPTKAEGIDLNASPPFASELRATLHFLGAQLSLCYSLERGANGRNVGPKQAEWELWLKIRGPTTPFQSPSGWNVTVIAWCIQCKKAQLHWDPGLSETGSPTVEICWNRHLPACCTYRQLLDNWRTLDTPSEVLQLSPSRQNR